MTVADEIFDIFERRGSEAYFGECVSQLEHALQAAALAEAEQAPAHLIVAAVLHDLGHLVHSYSEHAADHGVDTRHEALGELWLTGRFPEQVTAPVRLHVAAKRYLCATDPDYLEQLSPASVQSLALQGGPMREEERKKFENEPGWRDALRLRRWDDQAKVEGLTVPGLSHYRERIVEQSLTPRAA